MSIALRQCFRWTTRSIGCRHMSSVRERKAQELLDELFTEIQAQRFKDIVVIQTKFNADPRYLILANAFNDRHLIRGTEMINKHYKCAIKDADQEFGDLSIAKDWNVLDFKAVVVHLFSKDCRKHFDIEQLWAVGEKYDDLINFPKSSSSQSRELPTSDVEEDREINSSN